jgi:cardiolipin synthase
MLPKKVDTPLIGWANRSYYEECLEAGVRIFERCGAFIHCKTLVADDGVSIVGATNLDTRSFGINNEVNTFAYDQETALACKEIFLDEPEALEEILLPAWKAKHREHRQYFSQIIRLFSSLL